MDDNETVTVELPGKIVSRLREAVADGAFGSESEAVCAGLLAILDDPGDFPPIDDEWLRREVLPLIERVERGEEELIPIDEAFDGLNSRAAARRARRGAGG